MEKKTVTGRTRKRTTRAGVRWADKISRVLITCGGIGTIISVLTVCVFLLWVVLPLFRSASLTEVGQFDTPIATVRPPAWFGVNEYRTLATSINAAGELEIARLDDGRLISRNAFLGDTQPTATAFSTDGSKAAFGFADGTVRLVKLGFKNSFVDEDLPPPVIALEPGDSIEHAGGMITRVSESQFRLTKAVAEAGEPIDLGLDTSIKLIDYADSLDGPMYCVLTESGQIRLELITENENLLTGEVTTEVEHVELPFTPSPDRGMPSHLLLAGQGDNVYVAWDDGHLMRYALRGSEPPVLAEELDLVPEPDRKLTSLSFLNGRVTLMAGDSAGSVRAFFRIKPDHAQTIDGALLVAVHQLNGPAAAVTTLVPSIRSRMVSIGYADGTVRVYYVTNTRLLVEAKLDSAGPITAVALAPKDDGIVALNAKQMGNWSFDPQYPEVTLASLFLPVWYEGYEKPGFTWQSSSGSDTFEPKLSLIPLIFGTLKATIYSMLFGVPLALLAALFTSEFLSPAAKGRIKPTIEMMASLPSVVLGFLAGIVIAPLIEDIVPQVIASFFTIPFALLLGAHLWQLLPQQTALRLNSYRLGFIALSLPLGILLAMWLGPVTERKLFDGDFRGWLDGTVGSGTAGWLVLLLPLASMAVAYLMTQVLGPSLRARGRTWSRGKWALFDLIKFLLGTVAAVLLSAGVGWLINWAGWDPRGSIVDTYEQRNALIVGFVMGFAIIPIIYTIADDALSTVPAHLRSASLGAGATQWQTAMRIVIPTAMSGLFSAVMIGLGRAVGETMIVLMAAGNTSIMELNIFNGFQTLSALIATELPEAVRDSAHYRTLFLAALALFALTFVVNTVAELIRMRFRRRAYEL